MDGTKLVSNPTEFISRPGTGLGGAAPMSHELQACLEQRGHCPISQGDACLHTNSGTTRKRAVYAAGRRIHGARPRETDTV